MLLHYNVNVPCKSKYSVVPTIISSYPRIAVNHCHHPCFKPKAILCGQSDMETSDIDIIMLVFSVNVTPTQISQIMEQLKGPEAGTFMPKRVYDMNKKTEELRDFCIWIVA
jgi:hypothetical protein